MTPDQIQQLRTEGYSDEDIAGELRKSVVTANTLLSEGYSAKDVVDSFATPEATLEHQSKERGQTDDPGLQLLGSIFPSLLPKTDAAKKAQRQLDAVHPKTEPSIKQIAAGMVAQTAIEESAKVAGTAAGTAAAVTAGNATGVGLAAPEEIVTAPSGAGLGYVSGALIGGIVGSITAQEIEGRDSISWGRVAGDTLANFVPGGTEMKSGPRLIRAASRQLAKHPLLGTAIVGGVTTPAAASLERYIDTGETPPSEELMKLGLVSSVLGASLGKTSEYGVGLLRRFAGKPAKMIDDLAAGGDRGAVSYINALTENVDPKEFMTRENVGKYLTSLADNTKARLAPSKLVGKDATQAIIDAKNIVSAGREVGGLLGSRVQSAIAKADDPTATRAMVVDYLGGKVASLPPGMNGLQGDLSFARNKIRQYQQQLLDNHYSGQRVLSDPMRIQIEDSINRGDYMTRSYRFYEDAEYVPARGHLESLKTRLAADGMDQKQIDRYLAELNAKRANKPDELHDWVRSQNAGILKERNDELSPELRRYLGEYVEPGQHIAATMSKLSRLTAYDAADATIAKNLLDTGILKREGDNFPDGYMEINLRRGPAHIPLEKPKPIIKDNEVVGWEDSENLYGPPELQVAINQLYGMNADGKAMDFADSLAGDIYETLVSAGKSTKVLMNPPSFAVQPIGNLHLVAGMGMNPLRGLKAGAKMGVAQFSDSWIGKLPGVSSWAHEMDLPTMERFMRAKELGQVPNGILFGDIQAGLKGSKVGSKVDSLVQPLGKLYNVPDIMLRNVSWENHVSQLNKFAPGADPSKIDEYAAKLNNAVYPNYDYLSSNLKTLSRKGVPFGQFSSFVMELGRTQGNQFKMIGKMLNGSFADDLEKRLGVPVNRNAVAKEGMKRLAATSVLYAGYAAGIEQFNSRAFSTDEQRAIKETVVEDWNKNRPLIMAKDKDGKIYYTNSSYIAPQMQLAAPLIEGMKTGNIEEGLAKAYDTISEDLFGEGSFAMNTLSQAFNNHNYKTGSSISVSPDKGQRAKEIFEWAAKDLAEPGIMREIRKSRTQPTSVTIARQLGYRANSTTVEDGFRYKAGDIRNALNTLKSDASFISNRLEKGKITQEEYASERERLNLTYKQNLAVLNNHVANLKTLSKKFNLTEDSIIKMMRDNGLGAETALYAMSGTINDLPDRRGMTIADQHEAMLDMTSGERMKKIGDIAKDDPARAKSLAMREREYMRDKMLKMSERDKAVKSLSVEDGQRARYIAQEMKQSVPAVVLGRYRNKGLVPPEVEKQIKQLTK